LSVSIGTSNEKEKAYIVEIKFQTKEAGANK